MTTNNRPGLATEYRTDRCRLRALTRVDAEALSELRSTASVNRYIQRDPEMSHEQALAFIDRMTSDVDGSRPFYFAICTHTDQRLRGTVCVWNFTDDGEQAEVGYELHPDAQGRGIMREVLGHIIELAHDTLQLQRLVAYTHHENVASIALLKSCGFVLDESQHDERNERNRIYVLQFQPELSG